MADLLPNQPHIYDVAPHTPAVTSRLLRTLVVSNGVPLRYTIFSLLEFVSGTLDAVVRRPMITQKFSASTFVILALHFFWQLCPATTTRQRLHLHTHSNTLHSYTHSQNLQAHKSYDHCRYRQKHRFHPMLEVL